MEYFERDRQLAEVAESLEEKRKNLKQMKSK